LTDPSSTASTNTMAVPSTVTIKDMSGVYVLNKTISDSVQTLLKMQGVGFIVRQAVLYSTVTVTIKQYSGDDGKVHLDQKQVSTGGITNEEFRMLDWSWSETENRIWGKVKGKNRCGTLEHDVMCPTLTLSL